MLDDSAGGLGLINFVDMRSLADVQAAITSATGVPLVILLPGGRALTQATGASALCEQVQRGALDVGRCCEEQRRELCDRAHESDELVVDWCDAGLLHFALAIKAHSVGVCYLYGGGALPLDVDETAIAELAARAGLPADDYAAGARETPRFSADDLERTALLFEIAARDIVRFGLAISSLTHETRASLTAIMGRAGALRDSFSRAKGTSERDAQRFSDISDQCALINLLLEQSLAFCVEPNAYHFDMIELFGEVIIPVLNMHRPSARGRGIDLQYEGHLRVPRVRADARRLSLVFHNLLLNAVKYSVEDSTVKVIGYPGKEVQRVVVLNYGIGVPTGEEALIFEFGRRGSNAIHLHPLGMGFGLAFSREIVEAHRGTLELSKREDPTLFTVALPTR